MPGLDAVVEHFLEPIFEDSSLYALVPSIADHWLGLLVGGLISSAGIAIAYWLYVANPASPHGWSSGFRAVHDFLLHKWYFDELQDALVYRPAIAIGRFCQLGLRAGRVQGIVSRDRRRSSAASGSVVRDAQSGFVRAYALLLLGGFAALGVYFLVVSS